MDTHSQSKPLILQNIENNIHQTELHTSIL